MIGLLKTMLFALICPGAGQFSNGQTGKAVFFGCFFAFFMSAFIVLFIRAVGIRSKAAVIRTVRVFNFLYIAGVIASFADALYNALLIYRRTLHSPDVSLLHTIIFAAVFVTLHKNLKRPMLLDALADVKGLSDYLIYDRHKKTPWV